MCEQPKPTKQLPIFDRIVCIPVTATISVLVPDKFNATQVQTSLWNSVKDGMSLGKFNTANQAVGLVFTGTPHTVVNSSGVIRKTMRPLGIGLLTAGCIVLFFLIVGFIVMRIIKRRRNRDIEEEDDLSLQKDEEGSFAPTDSFISEENQSPEKAPDNAAHLNHTHSIARHESEVSRYSAYPTKKGPSVVSTSNNAPVKKNEPTIVDTNDEEIEINQYFCCK